MLSAKDEKFIRVPYGKGVAGWVAERCEVLNIPDAYSDKRFDQTHDRETGFRTQNILCVPICDETTQDVMGVLEAVNKDGGFNEEDIYYMKCLGTQATVALQNGMVYDLAVTSQKRVHALMDLIQSIHNPDLNANSLMFTVQRRTTQIVDSDRCTLYLVDHQNAELWSMQGDVNIQIPIDQGIVGACVTEKAIINIRDAYADERFDKSFDEKSGYRTRSIICVPIPSTSEHGKILGVLQLINKNDSEDDGVFTEDDERFLDIICRSSASGFERTGVARRGLEPSVENMTGVIKVHGPIEKAVGDLELQKHDSRHDSHEMTILEEIEEDDVE